MTIKVSCVEITRFSHQDHLMGVARVILNGCLVLEGIRLYKTKTGSVIHWPKSVKQSVDIFIHSQMLYQEIHSKIWQAYWSVLC